MSIRTLPDASIAPAQPSKGATLVEAWMQARRLVDNAKSALSTAECALANATNALGKYLAPPSLQPGERAAVWVALQDGRELCVSVRRRDRGTPSRHDFDVEVEARSNTSPHVARG